MQKGPSEIAVVQISGTEYITKCYRNMVDQIPQKRILWHWNQWESHYLHRRPHIWNSRTSGASRHHRAHEGTPAWTKAKPYSSGRSQLKDIPTCSSTDTYHMCRTRHFRWKWQCATEIQFLNTPHDRRCCHGRQAMTPLWWSSINTLCFTQKAGAWTFATRGWGRQRYLPPRLRGDMAIPTAIALDSSFDLFLISTILVDTNGNGQHHNMIQINHG